MGKIDDYMDLLSEDFDETSFYGFINDLLNLTNDDIIQEPWKESTSEQYKQYIEKIKLYAKYTTTNRREVGVFLIKIQDNKNPANARTLQRNFIAHLLEFYSIDACLAAIYSNKDHSWRLSFVKKEISVEVGKLKTKVSPAKRYSYLFGKDEVNHTAKVQLLELLENNEKKYTIEEIEEKFSVEKVTKEFFENYKENYLKLYENLEANKEFVEAAKNYGFTTEEFAKKLMGQIVFLYFLQKKGWLGVSLVPSTLSINEYKEFYNKSDAVSKKILEKYYANFDGEKKIKGTLLKNLRENEQEIDVLSSIFVDSKYDKKWGTGQKNFVRKLFERYRNLNPNAHNEFFDEYLENFFYDGLNNKRKNQYFSIFNCKIPFLNGGLFEPMDNYNWKATDFKIEDNVFSNAEKTGILDFFDIYNFTINEEEPLEKEVAVDPEMLGKIFEDLLDVKDRKSKGAFYTPREIVHYMCQESLANFLVKKVGVDYTEIKEFIQYGEMIRDEDLKSGTSDRYTIGESVFEKITEIDEALKNIKIADPAVGSGAFPLGMLNEIVKLRDIITSYFIIYNRLGKFGKKFDESIITTKRSIYDIKWNAIKNSIYAVDIENSAVDITKLRLWLSIVVDQTEVPKSGPEPLPNLDCKIMQGNSLVDEFEGIKLIDKNLIEDSKNEVEIKPLGKKNINNQMRLFAEDSFGEQYGFYSDEKRSIINKLINKKSELFGTNNSADKKRILEEIDEYRKNLFKVNFRASDKIDELMEIDNSHNKPYFSWELEFIEVFVENNGFDIVIGNPPYVGEDEHKDIFDPIKKSGLGKRFYCGKMDLLYFFFHLSLDISNNNSCCSYITTNYYITADGAVKLRNDFKERAYINRIVNFNEAKVFDSARGQHNIITAYSKKSPLNNDTMCKIWNFNTNENLFEGNKLSIMSSLNT
ncbi:MAG: Eco57I restriction-modification methylase domain-containing protein, partial [Clostridia bacterium]|nr:Eco57I restriction-modification methylase domain-containing protein [Clostridia bacterium]